MTNTLRWQMADGRWQEAPWVNYRSRHAQIRRAYIQLYKHVLFEHIVVYWKGSELWAYLQLSWQPAVRELCQNFAGASHKSDLVTSLCQG